MNRQDTIKFDELVKIVEKLRGPDGCPWDREQTRGSLRRFLIEEFYELIDALDENNSENIKEELGDLLFQIIIQSQLSKEEGVFDVYDVIKTIAQKMVQRHPHVFGNTVKLTSSEAVRNWWEEHKKTEGKIYASTVDGIPESMPALLKAQELQQRATKVGFDWDRIEDVFKKLEEEMAELRAALDGMQHPEIEDEMGDIFFVLVRIANFIGIDPDAALRKTNRKFIRRFRYMEEKVLSQGKNLSDMSLAEMDLYWEEAKKRI